ncbi:uncharacterized protein I206_102395 [Kwoniella pini CBS 10737]|uniref:SCY1 protein kinase n=1 Tax=Kwoniella pini CBS 10737 TaxID=1296096 RepID=A0A1B9I593_9TREE|nr:SCY1 protein kinase [Kwoniella pini CBS 10737]OCF50687.1 SCY1 protein kinase [Kwoniella pini CBS 10737]
MFAAASNLFKQSTYLSAYNIPSSYNSNGISSPNSSSTNLSILNSSSPVIGFSTNTINSSFENNGKSFNVGLWKVLNASHKTTNKEVSVWIFEKKVLDGIKSNLNFGGLPGKDWVIEQLKKEASALSRLRHPDILHMVEPLEESRSELTFITERVNSSLSSLFLNITKRNGKIPSNIEVDLDEVEIQKGTLQIAKALNFLHEKGKGVHLNLGPDGIIINSKGDWKLSGLSFMTLLTQPDGTPTKYVYPEVDARLPPQVQWKLDYLAPEYALDSQLTPSSDLYSLGCLLYAVHMGGKPPFQNRGSMQILRDNIEGSLIRKDWMSGSKWERCSPELKDLLPRLLTRHPSNRISLASLPSHPFFSSLAISTLNFLDATTFASKPREEKATFLKGLVRVLPTFSERLRKGKVLPSLLEEMKDPYLLPFILPNVFEISKGLSKDEFSSVLPKLQPLFALKDPPQNMLTLLEHLSLFEEKTTPPVFRENIMPLIYNSLECEHLPVQEKVLKTVPHLCEILDYGTVQNVLLVKVAILFTRTRILSVKVQTLDCFTSMVKTLDKATLTTKLVPLLAKIKTKEPAVMMATLAVHEAMGAKVDREAIATLVLPQLWAMSMGPLLNADQFTKFMTVVKTLGSRVEQEHSQHLRDVHRIEAQTASLSGQNAFSLNGSSPNLGSGSGGGELDFETLVRGGSGSAAPSPNPAFASSTSVGISDPWDDESWLNGSDDTAGGLSNTFLSLSVNNTSVASSTLPLPTATSKTTTLSGGAASSKLKARPVPPSTFNSSAFTTSPPTLAPSIPGPSTSSFIPLRPQSASSPSLTPQSAFNTSFGSGSTSNSAVPNYNISLTPQIPNQPQSSSPLSFMSSPTLSQPPQVPYQIQQSTQSIQQSVKPPPGWQSGLMQPTSAPKAVWGKSSSNSGGNSDWGDFDPLK